MTSTPVETQTTTAPASPVATAKVTGVQQMKKPKAIMFDITGTLTQSSFVSKLLIPFFKSYYMYYVEQFYTRDDLKNIILGLRLAAQIDSEAPKIAPEGASKEETLASIKKYVEHLLETNKENVPFLKLRFLVWFTGYERDQLKTPVYADVALQIQKWRTQSKILLYALSNGYSEANRRFLEKTNQGNLATLIQGYYDTTIGELTNSCTYNKVLNSISEKSSDVLFLTHSPDEARAAMIAGIKAIIVATHRTDMEFALASGVNTPIIRSFNELDFIDQ